MSSAGGHWFWSASLRYLFMLLLLTVMIAAQHSVGRIGELWAIFRQHMGFWCITGSIGFGLFYTGICYAGDHASGWVVAATFMFTVVTSLLVLLASAHDTADTYSTNLDTISSSTIQTLVGRIPIIDTDLLQNAFNKVWLMTVGSLAFVRHYSPP